MNINDNQQLLQLLENPEIFNINRLLAHSDHRYHATCAAAKRQDVMPWRHFLNGRWYMLYSDVVEGRPIGFEAVDFDLSHFNAIEVPGHLQLQGYDKPQYVNTQYPWDGHEAIRPPHIPKRHHPTASYVRIFEVPADWPEGVYISFQGVETAFNLWCNGKYVGYSEDSFTPSEFNLTPFVNRERENKLAVQVYKYASSSWLEDQDFWRMSGIFRDVYLYTKPAVHLEDFFVKTPLNETYDLAQVTVDFKVSGANDAVIEATLVDAQGDIVVAGMCSVQDRAANIRLAVEQPVLWSAENPYLYVLQLALKVNGEVVEAVCQPVGIREFKMINRMMHINGQRLVFRGVNRHEFSAKRGRSITEEEMEWDVKFMKAHNINAVRTSHYPNASYFYDLCDRYGLYVIDEANLETHGTWQVLGKGQRTAHTLPDDKPEWLASVLDRAQSMLERDKNHPSVLIWSCGNESYGGENLYQMSEFFRNRDETRLVHYEGIWWDRRFNETSDMESQMYTDAADIKKYLENDPKKPFILCEYSHAMANSVGGLDRYIELEAYDMYQGGFIWDYIDQVIESKDRYGQPFLAYGGDFDDRPSDYQFCTNGIVYANRQPTTKALAVKGAYAPFVIKVEGAEVEIFNKHLFTNLNAYEWRWTIETDGQVVAKENFEIELAPQQTMTYVLDLPVVAYEEEQVITVSAHLKAGTLFAEAGHEVAFGQGIVEKVSGAKNVEVKPFTVSACDYNVGIHGEGFEVIFSRVFGRIVSLNYQGIEYIYHPSLSLMPSFWRAPIDNDRGHGAPARMAQWKIASLYATHEQMDVEEKENGLAVTFKYHLHTSPVADVNVHYFVNHLGEIAVEMVYEGVEGLAEMFKFGMDMAIPADFDTLRWSGYGPDETYADREFGARYGTFTNKVVANVPGYVVPQACGNHTGVRQAWVQNEAGMGLVIQATRQPLSFSALPFTAHELENAFHAFELPPIHKTVLSINLREMGVGGDNSWGARPEKRFDLPADETYTLMFKISPIK